ncbi:unnamed protein product [Spirodela intermedia]|uniref:protein-serine/threonine phosphatase n=1 Tax=Spirodela intermedia TaxID=51605 RepID=A0A7I8LIQ0_SPIIN|nr:unnamed protein product [Spirodela intermedia]
MGGCLSSYVEGACDKGGRGEKRGGGLFDRRGGSVVTDPAELLAKVESGQGLTDEELQCVPGRMFLNGSSEVACLFTQQGRKGTNQDAMIAWENFGSRDNTVFCGIFDGHGPFGHMVAKKVRDSLPLKLCTQWKAAHNNQNGLQQDGIAPVSVHSEDGSMGKDEWSEPTDTVDGKLPEIYHILRQSLLKSFKLMDKELKLHPTIDCFCSGSTAITLVKQGQDLVIGNVGDSRAVLGMRDEDDSLVAVQLTVDLKPNLPREAERIQQCKGRVFALQDEPEVARVWLPNNDSPGLAMARAFGDFCLKDYGLISVPDVSYRHLTDKDEFIILATDGIWDVLSNKEAVDVVASAPSRSTAARALVDTAIRAWWLKFPTSKIDDCAVVCLFLNPPSPAVQNHLIGSEKNNLGPTPLERAGGDHLVEPIAATGEPEVTVAHLVSSREIEIMPAEPGEKSLEQQQRQQSRRLADCLSTTDEEEWSALEGVTRVNSLVNLPRFLAGDKRSASWRKWL